MQITKKVLCETICCNIKCALIIIISWIANLTRSENILLN